MKTIITRADDYASSHAANAAIEQAARQGFVKHISVMPVCRGGSLASGGSGRSLFRPPYHAQLRMGACNLGPAYKSAVTHR